MKKYFSRNLDELKNIVAVTKSFFEEHEISPALRNKVDLATEELFVNLVTYNTETQRDIEIELLAIDDGIKVSLTDFDVERFDPTAQASSVDPAAPLEERDPGGLGLYLVMKMVDSIHYHYRKRQSTISFTVTGTH